MDKIKILKAKPEDAEGIYKVRKITWIDTFPNKNHGLCPWFFISFLNFKGKGIGKH